MGDQRPGGVTASGDGRPPAPRIGDRWHCDGAADGPLVCWAEGVRDEYRQVTSLGEALGTAGELSARTVILDVEPAVAVWGDDQHDLDRGVARVLRQAAAVPGVLVVCFATNSARRPTAMPSCPGVRVVYLASAGKPFRTAPYRGFPAPVILIGDQVATDGVLAWRLGCAFVQFLPDPGRVPPGPRLLSRGGQAIRPALFSARR